MIIVAVAIIRLSSRLGEKSLFQELTSLYQIRVGSDDGS